MKRSLILIRSKLIEKKRKTSIKLKYLVFSPSSSRLPPELVVIEKKLSSTP